ncbi:MAG: UnbV, partial [Chthonomonadales bacterium]|nr:UnbV [Chthonomonadales bacterium]
ILQTIGNGCAFLDYDNDGDLDILLVGPKLALYRGDGKGHFTDVTHAVGLDRFAGHFLGCAVGDVDDDGFDDLYISGYRTGLLLRNSQGHRFEDITRSAGLKPQPWGTSCAFAETTPGSGRLDLYIGNYVRFGPDLPQLCTESGVKTSCGPRYYTPIRGVFYRNDGHGHFTEATHQSGAATASGRTLGVAFADFDASGRPGLALANDEIQGDLLQPGGHGSAVYQNVALVAGTALDRDGNVHGGMGEDWGDYDNDGRPDLFVATFAGESKSLYHNEGESHFIDRGIATGIGQPTAPFVAFGCKFLDYDNDSRLDLIIANGHVQDNADQVDHSASYRQTLQLFHNGGGPAAVVFEDVSTMCSLEARKPIVGRGLAVGDYDNDGRQDVLVVDAEGAPLLLHNRSEQPGHWLGVLLIGDKSNRDGYGAVLTAEFAGRRLVQQCQTDGSYLSASDRRVHFGLGSVSRVEKLTVRWPSGHTDVYSSLSADRYITLREGAPHPLP